MFSEGNETVIILGAGASWHYGYPTGEQLITNIIPKHPNDSMSCVALKEALSQLDPLSIDSFLKYNYKHQKAGKFHIAYQILKSENQNVFNTNYENPKGHLCNWYRFLLDALISGCSSPEDLMKNKLSIISFNYDMSLEFFLYQRLKTIDFFKDVADEFLNSLNIIHVYGQLYRFEWQKKNTPKQGVSISSYGRGIKHSSEEEKDSFLSGLALEFQDNIQVIGEDKQNALRDDPKIAHAKLLLSKATNIYTLGFGFHDDNIQLLDLDKINDISSKNIYCTNWMDSKITERKIFKCFKKNSPTRAEETIIISHKSVYRALAEDFNLI